MIDPIKPSNSTFLQNYQNKAFLEKLPKLHWLQAEEDSTTSIEEEEEVVTFKGTCIRPLGSKQKMEDSIKVTFIEKNPNEILPPPANSWKTSALYTTLPLYKNGRVVGTSFWVTHNDIVKLITCRHVIEEHLIDEVTIFMHASKLCENEAMPVHSSFQIDIKNLQQFVKYHPGNANQENIDLAAITIPLKLIQSKNTFFQPFFKCLSFDQFYTKETVPHLTVADPVMMYCYPLGLYDEDYNFPIVRLGAIATSPSLTSWKNRPAGLVNIPNYNCDSGAPVFYYSEGPVCLQRTLTLGNIYFCLLGVHHEGYDNDSTVPLDRSSDGKNHPLWLASYLKADLIKELW